MTEAQADGVEPVNHPQQPLVPGNIATSGWPRLGSVVDLVLAALLVYGIYDSSLPRTDTPLAGIPFVLALLALGTGWVVRCIVALGRAAVAKSRVSRRLLVTPAMVIIFLVVTGNGIPFQARWLMSKSAFVAALPHGKSSATPPAPQQFQPPKDIGLLSVSGIDQWGSATYFYDNTSGLRTGVAYVPDGIDSLSSAVRDNYGCDSLGGGWYECYEYF